MKKQNRTLEWLGFKAPLNIDASPRLGRILGFILSAITLFTIVMFLGILIRFGEAVFGSDSLEVSSEAIRNIGLALAAVVGLPFLVWRSIVAQQQVSVTEQGQITDRINKAVEGLGAEKTVRRHRHNKSGAPLFHWHPDKDVDGSSKPDKKNPIIEELTEPNLEVRLGAIYSLERIAKDSPRDHIAVMEILCAYVRGNATYSEFKSSNDMPEKRPRTDIQAAISVLARRQDWQIKLEAAQRFRLDLSFSDLTGVDFKQGDFSGALFSRSILERAEFQKCTLIGARFEQAQLNYSRFFSADLKGARWWQVTFTQDNRHALFDAKIEGLDLGGANISGLEFLHASASNCSGKPCYQELTFGDKETILSDDWSYSEQRNKALEYIRSTSHFSKRKKFAKTDLQSTIQELSSNPFRLWSPFKFLDLGTGSLRQDFRQSLHLTGWPYDDD